MDVLLVMLHFGLAPLFAFGYDVEDVNLLPSKLPSPTDKYNRRFVYQHGCNVFDLVRDGGLG